MEVSRDINDAPMKFWFRLMKRIVLPSLNPPNFILTPKSLTVGFLDWWQPSVSMNCWLVISLPEN